MRKRKGFGSVRTKFFMPMEPPTATHQEKQVRVAKGRPIFYDPPGVTDAREKLLSHLSKHVPARKLAGPVELIVKWCFSKGRHKDGEWRTTKPDTDNLNKLLKDCMTKLGFWQDDAQVVSEVCQKFWAEVPGIFIHARELEPGDCWNCHWYDRDVNVCCNPDSEWRADFRNPEDGCPEWEGATDE